jgi:hypothetical protein
MALTQSIMGSNYLDSPKILNLFASKTPLLVLDEAKTMLETVMRLYYARHDFELYDLWITFALAAIGNMTIADLAKGSSSDPRLIDSYRSTLILSAQGLNKQGVNFHLSTLVGIQLERAMKPQDLLIVQTYTSATRISKDDQALIAENSRSLWPIPGLAGINEDPDKIRLKNLISAIDNV